VDDPSEAVALILTLMASQPNARRKPVDGDVKGNFDVWFDGGAVKHDTGLSTFYFADGARAFAAGSLVWSVMIELPDGRRIDVRENGDRFQR
jgi:hypothetical protein